MTLAIRATIAAVLIVMLVPLTTHAWDRGDVDTFATLPPGERHPEGITADGAGNLYVTTFDVTHGGRPGQLFVFGRNGKLIRQVSVAGSSNLLLGLDFHPTTHELLVIDFGSATVRRVDPFTGTSSVFMTVPGSAGLNALTFDSVGNVYVSDSFQGIIWKTGSGGGAGTIWASSPLLTTSGVPGFGANGLAFNNAQTFLFVANTGNDTIVKIPVNNGSAGKPAVFVNSINGADGLFIDERDNIWVAANQADEIVVVNSSGRAIAKLGDFDGIDQKGRPIGLLFPASPVRSGEFVFVTNLAIDLRLFDDPAHPELTNGTVDSQWAAEVKVDTIAKIRARIPGVEGLPRVPGMDD
jgi:sugar lactone lactonase YvrE